jgi:hypothetical protein
MVFNRDSIKFYETFDIKLSDSVLVKLEDSIRNKKEMLITIDASHYGFRNGNGTVYRHDTVQNDIHSFVSPKPRPIIQQHRPDTSEKFGRIIAADYKLTDFYDILAKDHQLEGLSTEEYIGLCKDVLLPFQRKTPGFNGLGYVQVVGKLDSPRAIQKVLDGEFLTVSIGAKPIKLVCSECLTDQMDNICKHFANKTNDIFMLSESLQYEELSFVQKPADPYGKITMIHDGLVEEYKVEREDSCLNANVDVIDIQDFFSQINGGKKIVCVDNICTIINQEEKVMRGKKKEDVAVTTVALCDEFSADQLSSIKLTSGETLTADALKLSDSEAIADRSFAVVQKTAEGLKRRFPLTDALQVEASLRLIDQAVDLTDSEKEKAVASLEKAAKKFAVVIEDAQEDADPAITDEVVTDEVVDPALADADPEVTDTAVEDAPKTIEALCDELKAMIEAFEMPVALTDEEEAALTDAEKAAKVERPNPVAILFSMVASLGRDLKWAGDMLEGSIISYLTELGKETVAKGTKDELESKVQAITDELTEATEEIELLDEQNRDLNFQLRTDRIDELVAAKTALGLVDATTEEAERAKLIKLPYNVLCDQVTDYRKLKNTIKDSSVNNTLDIKSIPDPTLTDADSDIDNQGDLKDVINLSDAEKVVMSFEDKVMLFKSLFK